MVTLAETDIKEKLGGVLSHYGGKREELIPILQEAQEQFGYLPLEVMLEIAKFLKLSDSAVFGVSTFYAQFKFVPTGRKKVKVCRGTACHVRGGTKILEKTEKLLGIKAGETTEALEYTLESIACFGSCALAPVMVIDDTVHGRMTTSKVKGVIAGTE